MTTVPAGRMAEISLTCALIGSFRVAKTFTGIHSAAITSLDIDSGGEFVLTVSAGDESLAVYDQIKGKHRKTLFSKKYGCEIGRFYHRSNNVLHTSTKIDDGIRYLSLHDNQYLRYFKGHRDRVTSLAVSPTSDTFLSGAAGSDGVRIWDVRCASAQGIIACKQSRICIDPLGMVFALVSPEPGSIVLRLYDMRGPGSGPFSIFPVAVGGGGCSGVDFAPDGRDLLVSTTSGAFAVIDSFEGYVRDRHDPVDSAAAICAAPSWTPDGQFVVAPEDGAVGVWNRSSISGAPVATAEGNLPAIGALQFNPRHISLATTSGACLSFWVPEY